MKRTQMVASLVLAGFVATGATTAWSFSHVSAKDTASAWDTTKQDSKDEKKPEPKAEQKKEEKIVLPKVADGAKAELGKLAPDFTLKDLDGKEMTLSQNLGKYVVLEWFSPGCPACKQAYGEGGALRELPGRLKKDGVVWIAMNSDGPQQSGADPKKNKEFADANGMKSPILFDPTGAAGKAYGAKTTPHCFVIDDKGVLIYAGALDNAPYGKVEGEKKIEYVADAIAQAKAGKKVAVTETKSYG